MTVGAAHVKTMLSAPSLAPDWTIASRDGVGPVNLGMATAAPRRKPRSAQTTSCALRVGLAHRASTTCSALTGNVANAPPMGRSRKQGATLQIQCVTARMTGSTPSRSPVEVAQLTLNVALVSV